MSERFSKGWEKQSPKEPLKDRIKKSIVSPGPLRTRLDRANKLIDMRIRKLNQATENFSRRDEAIFAKIVNAYSKHDMPRANILASELAEIRKMEKMIVHCSLALEQIRLRLETVKELGDVVLTLGPAVSILKAVRAGMMKIFPEAERELGEVGELLNGLISEATQSTGMTLNFDTANEEAKKILNEAAAIAERRVEEKFPELPAMARVQATTGSPQSSSQEGQESTG